MRAKPHTHPCAKANCTERVTCYGTLRENHDGFPEVICDDYHQDDGEIQPVFCWRHDEREPEPEPHDAWELPFAKNH